MKIQEILQTKEKLESIKSDIENKLQELNILESEIKTQQLAEEHVFKGGCWSTKNGFTCTGTDFICPDCQKEKQSCDEIQEINRRIQK